jgi:hypothetical protein
MTQLAQIVSNLAKFLSNQTALGRFIVETVTQKRIKTFVLTNLSVVGLLI